MEEGKKYTDRDRDKVAEASRLEQLDIFDTGSGKSFPLFSVAAEGWRLADKVFSYENEKYRKKQQWKSAFHALLHPGFARRWFAFFNSSGFRPVARQRPTLYIKPFRVYMS